ncbi:MAG: hypothetical protein ACRD5K_15195 [Candidatus Acidiferrales bacterium]
MRILFSSDNTISFEWVIGSEFVQAEVSRDREVEWMFATAGEEPQFETGIVDDPTTLASRQGQEWQPAPAVAEEPDYASAQ